MERRPARSTGRTVLVYAGVRVARAPTGGTGMRYNPKARLDRSQVETAGGGGGGGGGFPMRRRLGARRSAAGSAADHR